MVQNQFKKFLDCQKRADTLRFITCGSVDDGKSTLIGRLLFETQSVLLDELDILKKESSKHGTQGKELDLALLADGLIAEREQGITIDVSHRYFKTKKRKFVVADTPGHIEFTRNMATAASTASLAIVLIDARKGVLEQTRRHSLICSLLGINHIVLAINKMDLVNYDQGNFDTIVCSYKKFTDQFNFSDITPIAISALKGDNINKRSPKMSWYKGPTLISKLELADTTDQQYKNHFVLPIQLVNRPNENFRGYSGQLSGGMVRIGDKVRIYPSKNTTSIKKIWIADQLLKKASPGLSITLELNDNIDVTRGDIITSKEYNIAVANSFEAEIIWMGNNKGFSGRQYRLMLAGQRVSAEITTIKYKIDVNSGQQIKAQNLTKNDISRVTINTTRSICFDSYIKTKSLGSFILIDSVTNDTIAAGMIRHPLYRANNIHTQNLDLNRVERERLNGHKGQLFWFTGLSGSGKSTIANAFANSLHQHGIHTYVLDGDNIRQGLNKDLGFTEADRVENIRRVAEVSKLMVDAGMIVLTAFISPFQTERKMARCLFEINDFTEVYVDTPIEICEMRDPKGLYKKARNGKLPNFTGIDSPYEEPKSPEVVLAHGDSM